jgi:hypothetical protein
MAAAAVSEMSERTLRKDRKIGHGAFGSVFIAVHAVSRKEVAVKIIDLEHCREKIETIQVCPIADPEIYCRLCIVMIKLEFI